jgi:multidrug resistance efflux pump
MSGSDLIEIFTKLLVAIAGTLKTWAAGVLGLVVQVLATLVASVSAWAAWRAADASRQAIELQRAEAQERRAEAEGRRAEAEERRDADFLAKLQELHESLGAFQGLVTGATFVRVSELQAAQVAVRGQLTPLRAHLPKVQALTTANPPHHDTTREGPAVLKGDLLDLQSLAKNALIEVETLMANL